MTYFIDRKLDTECTLNGLFNDFFQINFLGVRKYIENKNVYFIARKL